MRRQVEIYVDGQTDHLDHPAHVRAHLEECWECSGEADTLRLIKCALHRLGERMPTDLATARIRQWARTRLR